MMQRILTYSRYVVVGLVVTVLLLVSAGSAYAIALGDPLPNNVSGVSLRQVKGHSAMDEDQGSRLVRAIANDQNQVFQIEIQSREQSVPDPQEFLGDYGSMTAEVTRIIPLRAKFTRYSQGDQAADWSIYGQSGNFYGIAYSENLAPADWGE